MAIELHIWGPAFGLPSIDPECNAAVAYLLRTLTPSNIDWHLIPSHNPSTSPSGEFPLLVDPSSSSQISSFPSIITYITTTYPSAANPDSHLSQEQRADAYALTTFLQHSALPLLDLSLYTTSANYVNTTQPAYTAILPWHTNYVVPPSRREAARRRVQHLGLASLDVETINDDLDSLSGAAPGAAGQTISNQFEASKRAAEKRRQAPSLLPLGRARLKGLLGKANYTEKFKLDRLASECFEPLEAWLGQKPYLLTDTQPTSIDCAAWGYLSLMLYPECEQRWLKDSISNKFPKLRAYIERLRSDTIGIDTIDSKQVMVGTTSSSPITWRLPEKAHALETIRTIGREVASSISVPALLQYLDFSAPSPSARSAITRLLTFSSFAVALVAGLGYHFSQTKPDAWDYIFKHTDEEFISSSTSSSSTRRTGPEDFARANSLIAALRAAMNASVELDLDQQSEKERRGGALVGGVEIDID